MKFKIHMQYDGSNFSGWQKQKNAKSIQGTLIEAIEKVFSSNSANQFIDLQASGRTDAGVHALEQVVHLECKTSIGANELKQKLNEELPHSINIFNVERADDRFHARHSAKSRQYVYKLSKKRNPFERKFIWNIKDNLDISAMQEAANLLVGEHDFSSFSNKPAKEKSTFVNIESINIETVEGVIFIRVKASHFLWKMVRRIVGLLVEIGKGKIKKEFVNVALKQVTPEISTFTAPPMGLFLER